jgi:hypothetical protein
MRHYPHSENSGNHRDLPSEGRGRRFESFRVRQSFRSFGAIFSPA